jgi:hypothetical protein
MRLVGQGEMAGPDTVPVFIGPVKDKVSVLIRGIHGFAHDQYAFLILEKHTGIKIQFLDEFDLCGRNLTGQDQDEAEQEDHLSGLAVPGSIHGFGL